MPLSRSAFAAGVLFVLSVLCVDVLACAAITQKGTQCKRAASPGSAYCWQHGGTTKAERERVALDALRKQREAEEAAKAPPAEKPRKAEPPPKPEKKQSDPEPTDAEIKAAWEAKYNAAPLYRLKDGTEIKAQRDVEIKDGILIQDFYGKWRTVQKSDILEVVKPK